MGEQSHGRILQLTPQGELRGFSGVDIDIIPGDDTTTRMALHLKRYGSRPRRATVVYG